MARDNCPTTTDSEDNENARRFRGENKEVREINTPKIKCPTCGSDKYYFDGLYIECKSCGRKDWQKKDEERKWNLVLKEWGVE